MAAIEEDPLDRVDYEDDSELGLGLRDIVSIIWAGKWWVILFVAVALVWAKVDLYREPNIYQANALLQVQQKNGSGGSGFSQIQQMAQMVTGGATPAQTEIEILKSRSIIGKAVRKLDLDIHARPLYFPYIGAPIARHAGSGHVAAPLFGPNKYAWGGEKITVSRLILPESLYDHRLTLVALGKERYRLQIQGGKALLVGRVGTPASSADGRIKIFVRTLVARPGEHFVVSKAHWLQTTEGLQGRLDVHEDGKDTGIITMKLSGTRPDRIRRILNAIADTFLRQNVEQRSQQAQQSLSFIQKQLPQLQQQLNAAENRYAAYREKHQAVDLSDDASTVLQQLVTLEQNIEQLRLKRTEYAQLYTAKHPRVKALEQQIGDLEHKKAQLKQKIAQLPEKEKALLELERDVKVNTQIYTDLLNQEQQLKIVKAGTIGTVRIVDHAAVPGTPISPRRHHTLVLAVILGLFAGIGWIFLRRALHSGIGDPKRLEERLGLAVYAVVPHSRVLSQAERSAVRRGEPLPLLARDRPEETAVEALRSLRTSLHFALMENKRKSIMITGPSVGVGKSFISVNLGELITSSGQRAVIVDADMRRGTLHEYAGWNRSPGLSDVLASTHTLAGVLRQLQNSKLYILPSGTIPPNPSELLMHERFAALMQDLESSFDVVIIDTPPLMAVTDASIVGPLVGATFVVVKAGVTTMPEVEESVKRLRQNRVRPRGFIFNDFSPNAASGSYRAYAYAYYRHYDYQYKSSKNA